jgi:hypothetical protein
VNDKLVAKRHVINRRAFLYGAGGVAIGLPFLEGMPERSAWAQDAQPVFAFFLTAACGVEPKRFFPDGDPGTDLATLLGAGDRAVNELKDHAANLIITHGINYPQTGPAGCGHAEGLSQALTGQKPKGSGSGASGGGPSADFVISQAVNAMGAAPMTLYSGNLNNGFIEERLSFDASGKVRAATDNPYKLYQQLTGLASPATGTGGTGGSGGMGAAGMPGAAGMGSGGTGGTPMATELVQRRRSVNDLVRAELNSLIQSSKASAADRQRLQQHFDSIRDVETTMGGMGMMNPSNPVTTAGCTLDGVDKATLDGFSKYKYVPKAMSAGGAEQVTLLHMQMVALAFACNFNRVGSLQWGDGTDSTVYDVPSNGSLGWGLHYISHRTASNGALGTNATAEAAHAEIDVVRMKTFAAGLNHFRDRGLANNCMVMWNNHVAEGNHQMKNVPHIIWGNGGGHLKTGQYVEASGANHATLLNVLISAATGTPTTDFGASAGKTFDAIVA